MQILRAAARRLSDVAKAPPRAPPAALPAEEPRCVRVDAASGIPPELADTRTAYIYQPARTATQSGLLHDHRTWRIDFDRAQPRWENPLMGWTSSRDAVQGVALSFRTAEEAARFAARQGWRSHVLAPKTSAWRRKTYADNFVYSVARLKFIRTK